MSNIILHNRGAQQAAEPQLRARFSSNFYFKVTAHLTCWALLYWAQRWLILCYKTQLPRATGMDALQFVAVKKIMKNEEFTGIEVISRGYVEIKAERGLESPWEHRAREQSERAATETHRHQRNGQLCPKCWWKRSMLERQKRERRSLFPLWWEMLLPVK